MLDMLEIKTKRLSGAAVLPTRGSAQAAGSDLYADLGSGGSVNLFAHDTVKIQTGISMEIPDGYFGAIFPRSGLATKEGLRPANCVGVIDSDYRGEIIVAIHNDTEKLRRIDHGERVAQIVIMPYAPARFIEAEQLTDTDRGSGGFGSTGMFAESKTN